jgi:hypothetical protein
VNLDLVVANRCFQLFEQRSVGLADADQRCQEYFKRIVHPLNCSVIFRPLKACISTQPSPKLASRFGLRANLGPGKAGGGDSIPSLATMFSVVYRLPLPQICSIPFQFHAQRLAGVCLSSAWNDAGEITPTAGGGSSEKGNIHRC